MAQREAILEVFTGVTVPLRFFQAMQWSREFFVIPAFQYRIRMFGGESSRRQESVWYELDGLADTNGSRAGNLA